jgi:hypothetical protein
MALIEVCRSHRNDVQSDAESAIDGANEMNFELFLSFLLWSNNVCRTLSVGFSIQDRVMI